MSTMSSLYKIPKLLKQTSRDAVTSPRTTILFQEDKKDSNFPPNHLLSSGSRI